MDFNSRERSPRDFHAEAPREGGDLHRNYRRIGISAVAAAAPYCSGAKNPGAAPGPSRKREHEDAA